MRTVASVLITMMAAGALAAQEASYSTQLDAGGGLLEVQARQSRPDEAGRAPRVQMLFARADTLLTVDAAPALARQLAAVLTADGTAAAFDLSVHTTVVARSLDGQASLEFVCTDDVGCVPAGPLVIVALLSAAERAAVAAAIDSASSVFGGAAEVTAPIELPVEIEPEPAPPPEPEPQGPPMGRLTVNAIPFAQVEVDGVRLGDTPLVNMEIEAGPHTVRFVKEGFQTEVREVTVPEGEVVRVVVRMRREGG